MLHSIDAAKKVAKLIDTTVGYFLGESNYTNVLRDTAMLKRLNDINELPERDKDCVLYTVDHLLAPVKTQAVYK